MLACVAAVPALLRLVQEAGLAGADGEESIA